MDNITRELKRQEVLIRNYGTGIFPRMAGRKALAFIDQNFRNQSWEGMPWKRRKKPVKGRALLIYKGRLRRGNRMQPLIGMVRIYNAEKHAKPHNEGFNGTMNIPAHERRKYGKAKVYSIATRKARTIKADTGTIMVKAHTKNMRMPRRQFAPSAGRPSPTLNRSVTRQMTIDIAKIIKGKSI